ncbi:MAG: proline dehydrogenase family protein [Haloferacaceae archaeon]
MIPPVARRFVAGETAPVALDHVRAANAEGVKVILNLLGEHYEARADADADTAAYVQLLHDIDGSGLDARVSVKPTQLGLGVDEAAFRANYRRVVETAAATDAVVWCDMEDSATTDATLDAFETLARAHPGRLGVCLQANLRRTREDVARLADVPGAVRLVKGAYDEPPDVAYTDPAAVDEAYREDLALLFEGHEGGIAVGSHDPAMLRHAVDLRETYGTDFEVQMLMGVRERAQRELATQGFEVWQYAPYGRRWPSYFVRRLRERRANVGFAARALLGD